MKKLLYQLLISSLLLISFSPLSYAGWPFNLAHQMNNNSVSQMLQPILPAVVNVSVQGDIPPNQLPAPVPGRPYPRHFESMGSGVIVDAKAGYILTNAHVIHEAKTITVTAKPKTTSCSSCCGFSEGTGVGEVGVVGIGEGV